MRGTSSMRVRAAYLQSAAPLCAGSGLPNVLVSARLTADRRAASLRAVPYLPSLTPPRERANARSSACPAASHTRFASTPPRSVIAADLGLVQPEPRPPSGLYPRVPAATGARAPPLAPIVVRAVLLAVAAAAVCNGLTGGRLLRGCVLAFWRASGMKQPA
jgi:hypothetical protein